MESIKNQDLSKTIYVDHNIVINPSITIAQVPYLLDKYEFDKAINGKSFINNFSDVLLGTWIALFINMVAKFIGNKIDNTIAFENWEVYAFCISLGVYFIILLIECCMTTERKRIIKVIKTHFNIK